MDLNHLEPALPALEGVLAEMVAMMLGEEVHPGRELPDGDSLPPGLLATSRLVIHDPTDDSYLAVEVRTSYELARILTVAMLGMADPGQDDVLDTVAELGNIASGNVKTLLGGDPRLSLPAPATTMHRPVDPPGTPRVAVAALGQVIELVVLPLAVPDPQVSWPGTRTLRTG